MGIINHLALLKASGTGYLDIGYLKMTMKCIAVFVTCIIYLVAKYQTCRPPAAEVDLLSACNASNLGVSCQS